MSNFYPTRDERIISIEIFHHFISKVEFFVTVVLLLDLIGRRRRRGRVDAGRRRGGRCNRAIASVAAAAAAVHAHGSHRVDSVGVGAAATTHAANDPVVIDLDAVAQILVDAEKTVVRGPHVHVDRGKVVQQYGGIHVGF